jgi:hypothetical protein
MLPAMTPKPQTDVEHRAHLRANVQAAERGDGHPGDWGLHHFAVHGGPGDFTPFAPGGVHRDRVRVPAGLAQLYRRDPRPRPRACDRSPRPGSERGRSRCRNPQAAV